MLCKASWVMFFRFPRARIVHVLWSQGPGRPTCNVVILFVVNVNAI